MKKTYTTPIFVSSGDVVRTTLLGSVTATEDANPPITKDPMVGSIGYYL